MKDREDILTSLKALGASIDIKLEKMREIREITMAQGRAIEGEDIDSLPGHIGAKEGYMAEIDRVDSEIKSQYAEVQTICETYGLDSEARALYGDIQSKLKALHGMVEETYNLDVKNMEMLKKVQTGHAQEIKKMHQGTKGQEAYRGHVPLDGGIFIDKRQ